MDEINHAKNRGNKEIPLAILSRILPQSCGNPLPEYVYRKGLLVCMIVVVSLIVLLLVSTIFRMVHLIPTFNGMIFALHAFLYGRVLRSKVKGSFCRDPGDIDNTDVCIHRIKHTHTQKSSNQFQIV